MTLNKLRKLFRGSLALAATGFVLIITSKYTPNEMLPVGMTLFYVGAVGTIITLCIADYGCVRVTQAELPQANPLENSNAPSQEFVVRILPSPSQPYIPLNEILLDEQPKVSSPVQKFK